MVGLEHIETSFALGLFGIGCSIYALYGDRHDPGIKVQGLQQSPGGGLPVRAEGRGARCEWKEIEVVLQEIQPRKAGQQRRENMCEQLVLSFSCNLLWAHELTGVNSKVALSCTCGSQKVGSSNRSMDICLFNMKRGSPLVKSSSTIITILLGLCPLAHLAMNPNGYHMYIFFSVWPHRWD